MTPHVVPIGFGFDQQSQRQECWVTRSAVLDTWECTAERLPGTYETLAADWPRTEHLIQAFHRLGQPPEPVT